MKEAEWLAATDPAAMLASLGDTASERMRRLFACACVRRFWDRLADARSRAAVETAERYADGQATVEELNAAWSAAGEAFDDSPGFAEEAAWGTADVVNQFHDAGPLILAGLREEDGRNWEDEQKAQCDILRDLVGGPFHPVSFAPGWRTPAVLSLAARAAAGDFTALPILADALEEAGCDNANVLDHCRGTGPHVRGCHVVDWVLGRE